MRLSTQELVEAYRNYKSSPLIDHIEALDTEIKQFEERESVLTAEAENLERQVARLRRKNPEAMVQRALAPAPRAATPLSLSMPFSLEAEEIIQYTVEVEVYE